MPSPQIGTLLRLLAPNKMSRGIHWRGSGIDEAYQVPIHLFMISEHVQKVFSPTKKKNIFRDKCILCPMPRIDVRLANFTYLQI